MKLLYKELMLAAHPTLYIFTLLGCLVLVPSYPYSVIFMFGCIAIYVTFIFSRENSDTWYTVILPVKKTDAVKGKFMLILTVQLGQLIVSVPFNILRGALNIPNNPVGMDATLAWYGAGFLIYGVFNLVFLPSFYKSGYKAGKSFALAMVPVVLLMVLTEASVHFPGLSMLDDKGEALHQLPVFLCGAAVYAVLSCVAYISACRRFESVDL